jgi:tRNA modification GTPase
MVDTAGIRESQDEIEKMGIEKTQKEIEKASIVLYIFDPHEMDQNQLYQTLEQLKKDAPQSKILTIANKCDLIPKEKIPPFSIPISAKEKLNLDGLKKALLDQIDRERLQSGSPIITNTRHLDALHKTLIAVKATLELTEKPSSGELLAFEIKEALYHLGTITGQVSNDELLGNIFGKFCIGK